MSITNEQFWHLAATSRLLTSQQCQSLAEQFGQVEGAAEGETASALAKWLVSTRVLSRYQAAVLLSGKPGPFQYGDYQVFDRIGKGCLKGVFRAVHLPTQYVVFLKFLTGPATQDHRAMHDLAERTAAATTVRHEAVSRCYQLVDAEAYKFIACEPLEGHSLAEHLAAENEISPATACGIASCCANALAELHAHGVIHASVSPTNVWLLPDGRAKILQLPLALDPMASAQAALTTLSRAGSALLADNTQPDAGVAQELDYLPPEVVAGNTMPDARGDIYSLGCTLYTMLCGQAPPLGSDTIEQRLRLRGQHEIPLLDDFQQNVPRSLAKLVSFMLARDPAARYQAASHVVEAMKPYAVDGTQIGEPPSPQFLAYQQWLDQQASHPQAAIVPGIKVGDDDTHAGGDHVSAVGADDFSSGAADHLAISTEPVARRKSGGGKQTLLVVGTAALLVLAVVAYLVRPSESPTMATNPVAHDDRTPDAGESPSGIDLGEHSSSTPRSPVVRSPLGPPLWESPTSGEPLDLSYLPPGVQVVFALRPSAIVAHREGEKLLDAMGRWSEFLRKDLVEIAGTQLANIDRVHVGLLDASPNPPQRAWVIWTAEPIAWEQRLDRWEGGESLELKGKKVFQREGILFHAPRAGQDRLLVVAPRAAAEEVIALSGQPPRLRRELEVLAEHSDAARMINVLFAPNFLFSGGKELFAEEGAPLKRPVADFLGDEALGGLLSLHLDDDFFIELRIHGSADKPPLVMARDWRGRVHDIPSRVSSHVWSLNPSPHSRKILAQLPRMIELLEKYTRAAVEGRETILRCYLPVEAAHNLALATRLALYETSGTPMLVQQSGEPKMSVVDRLNQAYSLKIPRGPLDQAVEQLSRDLGVEIEIMGNDLQLEGITKNQSFALMVEDSTYVGVLREILKLANPEGKLVYLIKAKPEGGDEIIYITTRAAVRERGDELPPEFTVDEN